MDMNHSSFRLSVTKHFESSDYPQILTTTRSFMIFRVEVGSRSKVEFSGSTRMKLRVEGRGRNIFEMIFKFSKIFDF